MSVIEIKSNLHTLIDNIQEEDVLQAVSELVSSFIQQEQTEIWDTLNEAEQQAIEEGINQADAGLVISHQQVKEKYAKWFTK
jgi:predicted transcriptional regulator